MLSGGFDIGSRIDCPSGSDLRLVRRSFSEGEKDSNMADSQQVPAALQSALGIFIKELDTHVVYFRELLSALEQEHASCLDESSKTLEHRFHVIKGGAGFLKLEEIRQSAILGESMFKHGIVHEQPEEKTTHQFIEIVDLLERQVGELRDTFSG